MADERPKRHQSQTERDVAGYEALKVRRRSSPLGYPVETFDDVTGNHEGEDLVRLRARRPTPERLTILERKSDEDRTRLGTIEVAVAKIDGKLDVLPRLLALVEGKQTAATVANANEHETKRQGMASRTKIILAVLGVITTGLGLLGGIGLSGCAS